MISSGPEGTGLESRVAGWAASCDVALGADWKVAQYMYQQMPEQLEGVAPASSGSATRIRALSVV